MVPQNSVLHAPMAVVPWVPSCCAEKFPVVAGDHCEKPGTGLRRLRRLAGGLGLPVRRNDLYRAWTSRIKPDCAELGSLTVPNYVLSLKRRIRLTKKLSDVRQFRCHLRGRQHLVRCSRECPGCQGRLHQRCTAQHMPFHHTESNCAQMSR